MQLGLNSLYAFLDQCQTRTLVLATVVHTEGASYRKAGAMMLIDANMISSGLVSGGCLEDDLKAHAQPVLSSGIAKTVVYDLSQEESASMWGLGLGCGGRIEVLLERIDRHNGFGGLAEIRTAFYGGQRSYLHKVIKDDKQKSVGTFRVETPPEQVADTNMHSATISSKDSLTTLTIPVSPLRRLLVCGAGPDAQPLVDLAARLGWHVTVADPRPAYLTEDGFAQAVRLILPPTDIDLNECGPFQAAVIMTHNVERDSEWLLKLYQTDVSYIGLLGPSDRRDMLLDRIGLDLESRLHGPAGLDIGAVLPEEIALSIVAQIQGELEHRYGGPLSSKT